MDAAVVAEDLVKRYEPGARCAVDGMGFTIAEGEVFGLLGPSGAGKTTAVRMLSSWLTPTSGRATVAGVDVFREPARARQLIGLVPQYHDLDLSLSVRQNLLLDGAYYGIRRSQRRRRADELISWMGLEGHGPSRLGGTTWGFQRRVMIARALMHRPRVVFLDEPACGLDPESRAFVHERVAQLKVYGVTVVVTTRDVEEATTLCDRVGVVDRGKMLVVDSTAELRQAHPGWAALTVTVSVRPGTESVLVAAVREHPDVDQFERIARRSAAVVADRETVHYRIYLQRDTVEVLPDLLAVIARGGGEVHEVRFGKPTLEDVFLYLTGRELR